MAASVVSLTWLSGIYAGRHLRTKLSSERLHAIIEEAVEIERSFLCDALPVDLIGMNSRLMEQYIQFVADRLLVALGAEKLYKSSNPFDWMEMLSLQYAPDSPALCLVILFSLGTVASICSKYEASCVQLRCRRSGTTACDSSMWPLASSMS